MLCGKAKSFGADFVKIDNQGFHRHYADIEPVGKSAEAVHVAIENACEKHFDGALINCMGMPSECMFNRTQSAVSRCSDDFIPESRAWFAKNILQCAYNGTLQGQYHVNDWDMWWTDDGQAEKNSLCRAVSGGPIYISDKIGRTRPEILTPLIFEDGRILRCKSSAVPTADTLCEDPAKSGKPFKIINRTEFSTVLAVFNVDAENGSVHGGFSPRQISSELSEEYVIYEYFSRECVIAGKDEEINLILTDNDDFRLYSVIPYNKNGITPIGRTDKFISGAAVLSADEAKIRLYEGGEFSFVSSREVQVFAGEKPLEIVKNGILQTLCCGKSDRELIFKN